MRAGIDIRSLIRAATLLCVLCLPVSVLPQITNTSPESKANPVNQYKAHGYVNDFAGIIAPRFQSQLETISKELDQETQTQLAIVTVKSLEGLGIKDFATQLANRWGVGHQDTNRGILVLLAVKERQYRISVGLGLESVLTDEEADRLGKEMIPMLRAGNFATALLHLAKRLEVELPSKLK